jgi:serine/threonine-protein kinase ATR
MAAMASDFVGRDSLNGIDDNEIRSNIILQDHVCQTHTLLAMDRYASALKMDTKHVYQALPRLLSLWFDLVSVCRGQPESPSKQDPLRKCRTCIVLKPADYKLTFPSCTDVLRQNQNQANTLMASQLKHIPSVAFYTAMPQLISRVVHDDPETALVVKSILQRVLIKFPQQAMWPLAWLKGSKIDDRKKIGEEIFHGAQKALSKNHKGMSNLIKASDHLFDYLRQLAK